MIRSRFSELLRHLKGKAELYHIPPENFQDDTADMTVESGGHDITVQGLHFADFRYRGVILVERVPAQTATMLILHARAWLDTHDDQREIHELAEPAITLLRLDTGNLTDLMLDIEFCDPVYLSKAAADAPESGVISWDGADYTLDEYDLWTAETGEVNRAPLFPPGGEP